MPRLRGRDAFTVLWLSNFLLAGLGAVVNIDGGGIAGLLEINSVSASLVNFHFRSVQSFIPTMPEQTLTLAIHKLPPVYQGTCGEEEVGPVYDPTNAYNETNYNVSCRASTVNCAVGDLHNRLGFVAGAAGGVNTTFPDGLSLFSGPTSIVGRSLVIYDKSGQPVTCAVIRNQTVDDLSLREVTLEARFPAPIAGVVTFRQTIDDQASMTYDTQIIVDLFSNDGSPTTEGGNWFLVKGQAADPSSCRSLAEEPLHMTCKGDRCFSGYLVKKHGHLTIPSGKGLRHFFTDSNLPLDDIGDMSLVVTDPELTRYACASVHPQLGVVARFDDEVKGFISILPQIVGSVLHVNLTGLSGMAGGYHVHRFPVSDNDCSTTGGHFNPFDIVYDQSSAADGSSDQFEAGDLSGLFGTLAGNETAVFTTFSRNLLSEGLHGILGRSIVIHRADKSRWQCATLEPLPRHGEDIKRHAAVASFQGTYQGYVKLTQYEIGNGTFTGTVVEIDVRRDGNATFDHKWHVHQNPAAAYGGMGEGNCASRYAGGHYNPEGVDLNAGYSEDCRPENQLRCELGDMSGKHGKYAIHPQDSSLGRRQMYDSSLPLTGPNGVIHRSVVIHDANSGGARIACATLYPADTQGLSVTFRKPKVANVNDVKRAIAKTLSLLDSDVQFVHLFPDESDKCISVTFAVRNTVVKALNGQDFSSFLAQRGGTCGKFVVESDCLDWPNVDEDALAMVNINGGGIMGQLDIDGMLHGNVSFRFRSLKAFGRSHVDDVEIAIHTLPPFYRGSCSEFELGPVYDPTHAQSRGYEERCRLNTTKCAVGDLRRRLGIVSLGRRVTVFPGRHNFLKGPDSVIGRSLVLYNVTTDRPITCSLIVRRHVGTVEPVREISLGAKLLAPIAGTVTFTQGINDQTGESYETQIIASVFANDLSVPEGQYTWQLVKRQVRNNEECRTVAKTISSVNCRGNTASDCHFSNLTGKLGHLTVHWGRAHRMLYTDTNLPLKNVTGMTLLITDASGSNVSCASINPQIGVRAQFNDKIKGTITCIPTHGGSSVDVHLSNLQGLAGGYHVHRYPVSNGDCHSTGGHLNPFNVTHSPPTGKGSDDQFEVGDLSGIFGSLQGQKSVAFHRFAPNVYCERILGRSVVIHFGNGSRWQCASLEPVLADGTNGVEWTRHSAVAHFAGHYEGYVQLTQWESGDVSTNTVVDVNLYVKGNMSGGHKFHIHQRPVAGFHDMNEKNCHANFTGGHYNPLGIDLQTHYSDECNEQSQLRCEVGDLSSKHGLYSFYPVGQNGRRVTFDGLLPLTGSNSVTLRSVVFHAAQRGAARVACATLYPEGHKPFAVTLSTPKKIDMGDLRLSIARGLDVGPTDVKYLDLVEDSTGHCASVTFALPDSVASSLQGHDFLSSLSSNSSFGNYVVNSACVDLSEDTDSGAPPSFNGTFGNSTCVGNSGAPLATLSIWVSAAAVLLSASFC